MENKEIKLDMNKIEDAIIADKFNKLNAINETIIMLSGERTKIRKSAWKLVHKFYPELDDKEVTYDSMALAFSLEVQEKK